MKEKKKIFGREKKFFWKRGKNFLGERKKIFEREKKFQVEDFRRGQVRRLIPRLSANSTPTYNTKTHKKSVLEYKVYDFFFFFFFQKKNQTQLKEKKIFRAKKNILTS